VAAAAAIQRALHAEAWPAEAPLRVRLALHTGEAHRRDGDYYGGAVNRAARLRGLAHGGQALLSQATFDVVRDGLPGGVAVRDLGEHRLSDRHRIAHGGRCALLLSRPPTGEPTLSPPGSLLTTANDGHAGLRRSLNPPSVI
jgi:hypothetical protein